MNGTDIEGIKFLLAGKECISCAWRLKASHSYMNRPDEAWMSDDEVAKLKLRRDLFHGDFGCSVPGRRWKIPDVGGCSHWMSDGERRGWEEGKGYEGREKQGGVMRDRKGREGEKGKEGKRNEGRVEQGG